MAAPFEQLLLSKCEQLFASLIKGWLCKSNSRFIDQDRNLNIGRLVQHQSCSFLFLIAMIILACTWNASFTSCKLVSSSPSLIIAYIYVLCSWHYCFVGFTRVSSLCCVCLCITIMTYE